MVANVAGRNFLIRANAVATAILVDACAIGAIQVSPSPETILSGRSVIDARSGPTHPAVPQRNEITISKH
jgi:hypothetical protein